MLFVGDALGLLYLGGGVGSFVGLLGWWLELEA